MTERSVRWNWLTGIIILAHFVACQDVEVATPVGADEVREGDGGFSYANGGFSYANGGLSDANDGAQSDLGYRDSVDHDFGLGPDLQDDGGAPDVQTFPWGTISCRVRSDTDGRYPVGSILEFRVAHSIENTTVVGGHLTLISPDAPSETIEVELLPGDSPATFSAFYDSTGHAVGDWGVRVYLEDSAGEALPLHESAEPALVFTLVSRLPQPARIVSTVDLDYPAGAFRFVLRRSYDLRSQYRGPMGRGWTHSFDAHLDVEPSGLVKIFESDLGGADFFPDGSSTYHGRPGDERQLRRLENGWFELQHPDGRTHRFDDEGRLREVVAPTGASLALYWAGGMLIEVEDELGRLYDLAYDDRGRLTTVTDPSGRVCSYGYDDDDHLISATTPTLGAVTYAYDAHHYLSQISGPGGQVTRFDVDSEGRLLEVDHGEGVGLTTFSYDDEANTILVGDATGAETALTFDTEGRLLSRTSADGNTHTFGYSGHLLVSLTDPLGATWQLAHDERDALVALTAPAGHVTSYAYESGTPHPSSITDRLGNTTHLQYDAAGLLSGLTLPTGETWELTQSAPGMIADVSDPSGNVSRVERTDAGLPARVVSPSGIAWTYQWSPTGRLIELTDPLARTHALTYDDRDHLIEIVDPLGGATRIVRDEAGRPVSVEDATGAELRFERDTLGRIVGITFPDDTSETLTYGPTGRVVSQTDRGAQTTSYTYDTVGRRVSETRGDGSLRSFAYDPVGRLVEINDGGRQIVWDRDLMGRVNRESHASGAELELTHDALGRVVELNLSDMAVLRYEYDPAGRLTGIRDGEDQLIAQFAHGEDGRLATETRANGVVTSYTYDQDGRVVDISHTTTAGDLLATFSYTHDATGRITEADSDAGVTSYRYDSAGRLVEARYSDDQFDQFAYNAAGTLIGQKTEAGSTDYEVNDLHQLLHDGIYAYTYDDAGRRLARQSSDEQWEYHYGSSGRLQQVSGPDGTCTIDYDPLGRLSHVVFDGTERTFRYAGLQRVLESDGDVAVVFVPGLALDRPVLRDSEGERLWYLYDVGGNVVATTNDDGEVVERFEYRAYGEPDLDGSATGTLLHRGLPYEPALGLYYMRARFYDPGVGVFLTPDPGLDLLYGQPYAYAAGDPINRSDARGLNSLYDHVWDTDGDGGDWVSPEQAQEQMDRERAMGDKLDDRNNLPYGPQNPSEPAPHDGGGDAHTDHQNILEDLGQAGEQLGENVTNVVEQVAPTDVSTVVDVITYVVSGETGGAGVVVATGGIINALTIYGQTIAEIFDPTGGWNGDSQWLKRFWDHFFGDPTFVQLDPHWTVELPDPSKCDGGTGVAICFPAPGSLVRGDVPISGLACDERFERYRVEVGTGTDPDSWEIVEAGEQPVCDFVSALAPINIGDETVPGNLATLNTGLRAYTYPTHPAHDPTDLAGLQTIRLVVERDDGSEIEDRVTLRVGQVVPNALGGSATSLDQVFSLVVPEHGLSDAFRVFAINRLDMMPAESADCEPVSALYTIRPFSEPFFGAAVLTAQVPVGAPTDGLHICAGQQTGGSWSCLATTLNAANQTATAEVSDLAGVGEGYVLMRCDSAMAESSDDGNGGGTEEPHAISVDTFEEDLGQWSRRHGRFGALLERVPRTDGAGGSCVRLTNPPHGGTMGATIREHPFDALETPWVRFDYRLPPHVRVNILAKVDGRWYDIGLSDGPKATMWTAHGLPYFRRINMEPVGQIPSIRRDGEWHSAELNLLEMLRSQTDATLVETLILADFDSTGYLRLAPGQNLPGASFEIDNFAVVADGPTLPTAHVSEAGVQNALFATGDISTSEGTESWHRLARSTAGLDPSQRELLCFVDTGCNRAEGSYSDAQGVGRAHHELAHASGHGRDGTPVFRLAYAVDSPGAWAGRWWSVVPESTRGARYLLVDLRGGFGAERPVLGLRDIEGATATVSLTDYLPGELTEGWTRATIPVSSVGGLNWQAGLSELSFGFGHGSGPNRSYVDLASISLASSLTERTLLDLERPGNLNELGEPWFTYTDGEATITLNRLFDDLAGSNVLELSFAGLRRDRYSFAWFGTHLGSLDAQGPAFVGLRLRRLPGSAGVPFLYVNDTDNKAYVQLSGDMAEWPDEWLEVIVPLGAFSAQGVDLSCVHEIVVGVQWSDGAGTMFLDDLELLPLEIAREWSVTPAELRDPVAGPSAPSFRTPALMRPVRGVVDSGPMGTANGDTL